MRWREYCKVKHIHSETLLLYVSAAFEISWRNSFEIILITAMQEVTQSNPTEAYIAARSGLKQKHRLICSAHKAWQKILLANLL